MQIVLLSIYGFFLFVLFLYSMVQLNLLYNYKKSIKVNKPKEPSISITNWPTVCVQLPVYNEQYVVERLIDSIMHLDYPKDKLSIQVLDDSTDETVQIIADKVKQYEDSEISIEHIQRPDRVGYKAGALAYGLKQTTAEYIAIFDADFVPSKSFLKEVIPEFTSDDIGMVQTRWGHLNSGFSWLTSLQAFGLDAHFIIEQIGRLRGGHLINFNGTAGVWRKETIIDAGGWQHDTLTEDLDLSYRAQLKGWQFAYLENVVCPAELPIHISPLKKQQYRWTKGAAECLRKNGGKVLTNKTLSFKGKLHGIFHLANSAVFIAILGAALFSIPALIIKTQTSDFKWFFIACNIFMFGFVSIFFVYYTAFKKTVHHKGFLQLYFMFLAVSAGLSFHNTIAVLEGYFGKKTPFVRTPKFASSGTDFSIASFKKYKSKEAVFPLVLEFVFACVFLAAVAFAFYEKEFGMVLFHVMLSLGYFFIFFSNFSISLKPKVDVDLG